MTIVVGWVCEDGIILAADDEGTVQSQYFQRRPDERKIRKVGNRCALALVGNAASAWGTIQDLADRHPENKEVSTEQLVEEMRLLANEKHAKALDVRFVIAGYKDAVAGKKRGVIYELYKTKAEDQFYEYREAQDGICYSGVEYVCYFLEQYLGRWTIKTMEQAKRAAGILIEATRCAGYGVGAIGSIAKITEQQCEIITDKTQLALFSELGQRVRNSWSKEAATAVLQG
jgi:20S proteasome alpha/beta subunit